MTNVIDDTQLAWLYLQAKAEGLLEKFFYQGVPDLRWFLDYSRKPENLWLLALKGNCPYLDSDPLQIAGLGYINSITEASGCRKGEVGMLYTREYQGWFAKEATGFMIDYCFDKNGAGLDVLYGTTPHPNRAALIFSRRMGFEQFGPIPEYAAWEGKPCGAIIDVLTKKRWAERWKARASTALEAA